MVLPLSIKTLLFDLDGTICQHHPSSQDIFFELLDEYHLQADSAAKRKIRQFIHYYWSNSPEAAADMETYGAMNDAFWTRYLQRKLSMIGIQTEKAAELASLMQPKLEERYQPETVIADDVRPTLKSLRAKGYKIGLVTNRSKPVDQDVEELGLRPFFDFLLSAGEIDSWKPAPEIFEYALYLAESNAVETAYIGDNLYTDIIGAEKAGLFPILLDPNHTFPDAACMVIRSLSELTTI
jgi:HAD superfamily hydrolase (TIGR01549 family)